MDLLERTIEALDWRFVVDALAAEARTAAGARAAESLTDLGSIAAVDASYDAIEEVIALEEVWPLPIGAVGDISALVRRTTRGESLDAPQLRQVGGTLEALSALRDGLQERDELAPTLSATSHGIAHDLDLTASLMVAFDPQGRLSGETYPELAELRVSIIELQTSVRRTLEDLLKGDQFSDILQDKFVAMRGDRYVLPIKQHAKRWDIGVVHGTSGSGQTVFVEPHQVVEISNRLRIAEGRLRAAEQRILAELSRWVGMDASAIGDALTAATAIDLSVARRGLARRLAASRPTVRSEGVVRVTAARHPVLVLRGIDVIANDLEVGGDCPALVLTGPNTGGKTVALKTIGLCALLVRIGCFVPADPGSRVDRYEAVLADIGDAQTIRGDLSSFSAHLVALRAMLDAAAPGRLLLLDELCTGTDPAQGAALGRSVIEALLDKGPAVVATTHFAQLKALAMSDVRVAMAAVEYADGKPTYRVVADATGESHAFDTAIRMGLDDHIVTRGRELMDDAERALSEALGSLDDQRASADAKAREATALRDELTRREAQLSVKEERIAARAKQLENSAAAAFIDRLKRAEKAISAVVAELQRSPSHGGVDSARQTLGALKGLVPTQAEPAPAPVHAFEVGDRVRHRRMGSLGEVTALGDDIEVRIGAMRMRVAADQLEPVRSAPMPRSKRKGAPIPKAKPAKAAVLADALKLATNTVDLRGMRVDEGLDAVDAFLDEALSHHINVVFVLHGHGTGAMKQAVRRHLRESNFVGKSAPANADQGGDAFTVASVRMP